MRCWRVDDKTDDFRTVLSSNFCWSFMYNAIQMWLLLLCFRCQQYVAKASCFPVIHPAISLSVFRTLTSVLHDVMSLYLTEQFQWNLAQLFLMWVSIAEKVFEVKGQGHVKVVCVHMCDCYNSEGIHISSVCVKVLVVVMLLYYMTAFW